MSWATVISVSAVVVFFAWTMRSIVAFGIGIALFGGIVAWVNFRNRQRSILFQIASAAALTSTSIATSLSASGLVEPWAWRLWFLLALQATAGILVVHARLDARIAQRSGAPVPQTFRRAAFASLVALAITAAAAIYLHRYIIAGALIVAALAYYYDLRKHSEPSYLQLPLKSVGQRALAFSSLYAILLIAGLW